jgi:hypothetical protein
LVSSLPFLPLPFPLSCLLPMRAASPGCPGHGPRHGAAEPAMACPSPIGQSWWPPTVMWGPAGSPCYGYG